MEALARVISSPASTCIRREQLIETVHQSLPLVSVVVPIVLTHPLHLMQIAEVEAPVLFRYCETKQTHVS